MDCAKLRQQGAPERQQQGMIGVYAARAAD